MDNYHNIISDNDDSNSDDESDAETISNEPSVNHHNPVDQLLDDNGNDPAHLSDDETCVSDNDSVHSDEFSFNMDNAYNDDDGEPSSEILPGSSDETPNCESTTINNSVPSNEDENQPIYQDGDVSDTDTTVQDDPNQGAPEEEDTTSQETISSNNRPRRACVNQGIERLEMDSYNKNMLPLLIANC